jgi:hypothetical protein
MAPPSVYSTCEMTDSADHGNSTGSASKLGKRERLVGGARRVLHEQGVEKTTLADIAQAAEVPVTDGLDRGCAELMTLPIDWTELQFRSMGRRDACDVAVALIASYQGISLLTNTFRDPSS